jgi:hypothetical protein
MKSFTSRRFRALYEALPSDARRQPKRAYTLFRSNPGHPGLRFKPVEGQDGVFAARIGLGYRALGLVDRDEIVWVLDRNPCRLRPIITRLTQKKGGPERDRPHKAPPSTSRT